MVNRTWLYALRGLLFGTGKHDLEEFGVKELTNTDDWRTCVKASAEAPVFVFKHSTACPVSAAAYHRVADYLQDAGGAAPPFFLVKVIESRPLSNDIAKALGVTHQSPQLILVKDGQALWDASHGAVGGPAISEALKNAGG